MRILVIVGSIILVVALAIFMNRVFFLEEAETLDLSADEEPTSATKTATPNKKTLPSPKTSSLRPRPKLSPDKKAALSYGGLKEINPQTQQLLQDVRSLVEKNDVKGALDKLKLALEAEPNNAHILAEMGFIYGSVSNQPELAIGYLEKALRADADHGQASFELVSHYLREGKVKEGRTFLEAQYKKNPDSPMTAMALGDFLARSGNVAESLSYLQKVESNPDFQDQSLTQQSAIMASAGDNAGAIRKAEELVNLREKRMREASQKDEEMHAKFRDRALIDLAYRYIDAGQCEEARRRFDQIADSGYTHVQELSPLRREIESKCPR